MATLKHKIALVTACSLAAPGTLALAASAQASTPSAAVVATEAPANAEEKTGPAVTSSSWSDQWHTSSYVGYEGSKDGTTPLYPRVGEVFYLTMTTGVVGSISSIPTMGLAFNEQLAPDVTVSISSQYPVKCQFSPLFGEPWQDDPGNCFQTGVPSPYGGTSYGGRWLDPGQSFKVKVPVTVSKVKNGIGDGDAAKFYAYVGDGLMNEGFVRAEQSIFVFPAAAAPGTGGTMTVGQKMKLPKKQVIKGKNKRVTYKLKSKNICKLTNRGKKVKAKKVGTCTLKALPKRGKGKKIVRYTVAA